MKIGEKIKALRTSKLMTQSELAGNNITRNMLSRIENGAAIPSLPTLIYIASRLNVPAGYLIADEDNELIYRKINCIEDIKRAYLQRDYKLCLNMCKSDKVPKDDEILLIMAESSLSCAKNELFEGRLRSGCALFDEALDNADNTIYNTDHIKAEASVIFRYLGSRVSRTLYSSHDISGAGFSSMLAYGDEFCKYALALEYIDSRDAHSCYLDLDRYYDQSEKNYANITDAYIKVKFGDYAGAYSILKALIDSGLPVGKLIMYSAMFMLEKCCKENGDYKSAYDFSSEKVRLLERMLSEDQRL